MELGKAYIQVIPSTKGIKGQLTNELSGATSTAGSKSGKGFMTGFGKTALKTMGAIGLGVSVGEVFSKGWNRMTAIDNAKAKLTSLGHSTEEVAKISENANKAVKGTAYGMDAAMTAAASATAAGIKPGKELTRYLSLMGDAAAVAGVDMNEMGSIFNKVAANGKVTTEEMNQLADRGIPIWQLLAKETGMSMDEMRTAIQNGEIGIDEFQNAIEAGMGGAAKTIGSTTISGAISNIGASLSRMGANFLGSADNANSFAGKLLPLFNNLMGFMGKIETGASVLGQAVGNIIGPIIDSLGQLFTEVGEGTAVFGPLKTIILQVSAAIGKIIAQIVPVLVPAMKLAFSVMGIVIARLKAVWKAIQPIITIISKLVGIVVRAVTRVLSFVNKLVSGVKTKLSFSGLVEKVRGIWERVKEKITEPITKAKEKVSEIIGKIKGLFPLSVGKIFSNLKVPHINISGGKAPFGIGGLGTKPSISVSWYAKGGIVNGATLIGAGEKGSEAIVPLDPFWDRLEETKGQIDYDALGEAIARSLAHVQLTSILEVDGRAIAKSTAPAMRDELNRVDTISSRKLGLVY